MDRVTVLARCGGSRYSDAPYSDDFRRGVRNVSSARTVAGSGVRDEPAVDCDLRAHTDCFSGIEAGAGAAAEVQNFERDAGACGSVLVAADVVRKDLRGYTASTVPGDS